MKKSLVTANRGFTLVEIMVALAILLILGSIAITLYVKNLDRAREAVCESNLKGLQEAILLYGHENHALPATLGDLKLEHLKQGYDLALKNAGWKTRMAHTMLELNFSAEAHAFSLSYNDLKSFGANEKNFSCPADHNGGASYALNTELAGRKWADISGDTVLIAESDSYTFSNTSDMQYRHGNKKKALAVTMYGHIIKLNRDDVNDDASGGGDNGDNEETTICHNGKITMTKSGDALAAHLAHGDTVGPCP